MSSNVCHRACHSVKRARVGPSRGQIREGCRRKGPFPLQRARQSRWPPNLGNAGSTRRARGIWTAWRRCGRLAWNTKRRRPRLALRSKFPLRAHVLLNDRSSPSESPHDGKCLQTFGGAPAHPDSGYHGQLDRDSLQANVFIINLSHRKTRLRLAFVPHTTIQGNHEPSIPSSAADRAGRGEHVRLRRQRLEQ